MPILFEVLMCIFCVLVFIFFTIMILCGILQLYSDLRDKWREFKDKSNVR